MPIDFTFDADDGVVRTTVSGTFTLSDLRRHVAAVLDRKAYRHPELIDARLVEPVAWPPRDLLGMADLVRQAIGKQDVPPRAVVVSSDSHFGQARVFASFVAGWLRVGIFDDLEAAEQWMTEQATARSGPPQVASPAGAARSEP